VASAALRQTDRIAPGAQLQVNIDLQQQITAIVSFDRADLAL
jgi:hypothetical protein